MKPSSILVTIVLVVASLGFVVWVGQYRAAGIVAPSETTPPPAPTQEDLPLPKSPPYGKAVTEEVSYDFGTNYLGAEDEHTFTIQNSGEGPLEIKLGKPTCQCTVGEISKVDGEVIKQGPFPPGERVLLEPKDSVKILIKWVMKAETEKFRQSVPVFTTDPDRRQIDLEITGKVDQPVHLTPGGFWELGEMSRTEPTKAKGYAFSLVYSSFTITELPRENGLAKVSFEPADKEFLESKDAKCGYIVHVEVGPNIPIGMFRETIKLHAVPDDPQANVADAANADVAKPEAAKPEAEKAEVANGGEEKDDAEKDKSSTLEFTLTGHRHGPIDVRGFSGVGFNITSNRMIFGDFPAAEGKKGKVTLYVKGQTEDLELKSVEPADTRFKVQLKNTGKSLGSTKLYDLEVEIPPGPPGKHQGTDAEVVDLKLNHPEAPDFKLLIDYNAKR